MQTDLEIMNYDTEYLDAIEGSVTDLAPVPTAYPAQTRIIPNSVVLPSQQGAPNPIAGALAHLMAPQPSNGERDAYAIQHMQAMSEKSSPTERNRAKLVLIAGWVAIAGIIAVGLHQAEMIDSRMAWLCFVIAFAYGTYKANADENAHSPAGVERHKTDIYGRIRSEEIAAGDRANARNHETFNRVIDQVYGGGSRAQNRITKRQD